MKKLFFIPLLFVCILIHAQKSPSFRLNIYTNYVFDDRVDSYYSNTSFYDGTVKGSFQWGAGFEFMINRDQQGIELTYLRQDTKAPTNYYDNTGPNPGIKDAEFDVAINYIFLGSTRYVKTKSAFEPYGGIQLGVGIIDVSNPTNGSETNNTRFAWGLKLGTNIWLGKSQSFGIKLQGGLQSVSQAVGGGIYFGTGGVSPGLASYSTVYQFSLGGGIALKFGGK